MKILSERIFTPADQENFAALSGDANPLHMDALEARRTIFGAPVVHGVHLALWALESLSPAGVSRVIARFNRGVTIGARVQAVLVSEGDEFGISIRRDGEEMSFIGGRSGGGSKYEERLPGLAAVECKVRDFADAAQAQGSLPLAYCAERARRLFPRLSEALPDYRIAALLATTRLVGMECPGRYSLFSALEIAFGETSTGVPAMNYRVDQTVAGAGMLRLAVDGPGFRGRLRAFLRPAPYRQASSAQLAKLVARGEFAAQRALVIGGSRGIGEAAAKLLAAGGAKTTITYRHGKQDAEAVAGDIGAAGGHCRLIELDVTNPAGAISVEAPPTHIYYFATPHISGEDGVFSARLFAEYCRYYVTGFVETLLAFGRPTPDLRVFYPSTIFLSDPAAHFAEYCAAKAAGEEACRQLGARFPEWRIHAVRLPRLLTDQNNGFQTAKPETPEDVMLKCLRDMK